MTGSAQPSGADASSPPVPALLATGDGVARVQAALRDMGLDGWLLYDFKDRNPIGRSLLGLEWTTRRGFALVPAEGRPRLLIHAIEHSSWRHLDWPRESYASRVEMVDRLRELLSGCARVATETSARADVPYLDLLPAGIRAGDLLLIDLWGALHENSVPADQTWMGFMGSELPPRIAELWETVKAARDGVVESLRERWARGEVLRGFEGDDVARRIIARAGDGEYFIHRTGHSIDLDIHGRGPNLDNLETRDDRVLVPGVGFSVEPGIYIPDDVGLRTEINVYMGPQGPEVTVSRPQRDVFLLLGGS